MAGPGPPGSFQVKPATKELTVDAVVNEIATMGFPPYQVREVINKMLEAGQNVDVNVVIDRLTNGPR